MTVKDWDDGIPLLMFAAREAVQESLGFSPAQLVFGHEVRGPLKGSQGTVGVSNGQDKKCS